jgi:hypothetical protein
MCTSHLVHPEAAGEKQRKGEGREREREFKQPYTPAQF